MLRQESIFFLDNTISLCIIQSRRILSNWRKYYGLSALEVFYGSRGTKKLQQSRKKFAHFTISHKSYDKVA